MSTRTGLSVMLAFGIVLCGGLAAGQGDPTSHCLDYADYMHVTATVPGEARYLDRRDDLVYTSSLQVLDTSLPGAPAVVGAIPAKDGDVRGIVATATHLYVIFSAPDGGGFNGLAIYDLAVPTSPALLATMAMPQFMTQLRISGDRAYLRNDQGRLLVVDIADPAAPLARGSIGQGWLDSFDLRGDYLYAVDNVRNDVVVIDVSDPTSLAVDHRLPLAGTISISFAGGYGYFVSAGGTDVLTFSGPDAYAVVASRADLTRPLVLRDGLAYAYGTPLQVYDLADATDPQLMITVPFVVHDGVVDGTRGLFGISNAFVEMDLTETMDLPGPLASADLDATLAAILAAGTDVVTLSRMGLQTWDATDCAAPVATGDLMWQGELRGYVLDGGYLYVLFRGAGFGRSDLRIYDLNDPAAPTEVGFKTLNFDLHGLTRVGDYLYSAQMGSLYVIDVFDPTDPFLVSAIDGVGFSPLNAVDGADMVVADGTMLRHFDVGDPGMPQPTTVVDTGREGRQVLLAGGTAYFVHAGGVQTYAVDGLGAKNLLGELMVPGGVDGAVLDGDALYVEGSGIFLFDVSDPATPTPAGNLGYLADRAAHLTIVGDCLYYDHYLSNDRGRLVIAPTWCQGDDDGGDGSGIVIDIKPGSDRNPINCRSRHGVIPVAILTTDTFDALTVDHTTVRFGPGEATETHRHRECVADDEDDGADDDKGRGRGRDDRDDRDHRGGRGHGHDGDCDHGDRDDCERVVTRHEEDVDGDGDIDLVLHFRQADAQIACGDTEAWLWGETFAGEEVMGSDAVCTTRHCGCDDDDEDDDADKGLLAAEPSLSLAPNPFNPQTTIAFDLPRSQRMRVEVYDVTGRRVAVVADEVFALGENRVVWRGADDGGRPVASGVYFVRLSGPGIELNQRALLLK